MKLWKNYGNRLLAVLLVAIMLGTVAIPGTFAEETTVSEQEGSTSDDTGSDVVGTDHSQTQDEIKDQIGSDETETGTFAEETTVSEQEGSTSDDTGSDAVGTDHSQTQDEIKDQTGSDETETITVQEESTEPDPVTETGISPYKMTVTFDGKELSDTEVNDLTSTWGGTASKTAQIQLVRDTSVAVDETKKYILCLKVSDIFYFNGLPEVDKITGAEDCAIKSYDAPKVYTSQGTGLTSLPGYSKNSGEIRITLNTNVDTITIPNVSIGYNRVLSGYYMNGAEDQSSKIKVEEPFSVSLVTVSPDITDLTKIEDSDKIELKKVKLDSAELTRATTGSGITNSSSVNKYTSADITLDRSLSTSSTIAWGGGTSALDTHYCKSMVIVFHCPYVEVNGEPHYLSFDAENDTAIKGNYQNTYRGYRAKSIVYNETDHTITYTFENIYLELHKRIFYTPIFSWPTDLDKNISGEYPIKGYQWEVTENIGYTGDNGGWKVSFAAATAGKFVNDYSQVVLRSSANPDGGSGIAKREISNRLDSKYGEDGVGALGFFDVHNDGSANSPDVKISFEFNTDNSPTKYYVTRVNLPASTKNTEVSYTLEDKEGNQKTGTKTYTNSGSFFCYAKDLNGGDSSYYIKKLSYQTVLEAGKSYHQETAHVWRNRYNDYGLFYGYIDGEVGTKASAKMTIEVADRTDTSNVLTQDGKIKLESTETSTVSDQDYVGFSVKDVTIDGSNTTTITAGGSAKVKFNTTVSSEEFYKDTSTKTVNGYHMFRDGIVYLCLPDGVSISGKEQAKVTINGKTSNADSVTKLKDSECTVNGTTAYWWEIKIPNINANAYISNRASFRVEIQLATDLMMSGVTWNFNNCLALRTVGQGISWVDAATNCRAFKTTAALKNDTVNEPTSQGLAAHLLNSGEDANNLGMNLYQSNNSSVNLNIARAEAKLDVETHLYIGDQLAEKCENAINDSNTDMTYEVKLSSNDGGKAENFEYYVPIVSTNSVINANGWVGQKDFGIALQDAAELQISKATTDEDNDSDSENDTITDGFQAYYTTDENLSPDNIRGNTVNWLRAEEVSDFTKVTAVKIASSEGATIDNGGILQFSLNLKYDNTSSDFDQMAGCMIRWRSFGHYTYTRNGATTTNTYPNGDNTVKARYKKDLTSDTDLTNAILDTSASSNEVAVSKEMPTNFKKEQALRIKNVILSNGTQLITEDPKNLSGSDANQKFQMYFNLSNGTAIRLLDGFKGGSWTLTKETSGLLQAEIYFSTALTDANTPRYVDITVGNDDINIVWRVKLNRVVAAADAQDSGVTVGEQFRVPNIAKACSITQNSAFSALYVINNYVPANHLNQTISWVSGNNTNAFPKGTTLILMEVSDANTITSYWNYKADGTETVIDLSSFKRMGAKNESYSYDTTSTSGRTLRYLFAIDFEKAETLQSGTYDITFSAKAKSGSGDDAIFNYPVTLTEKTSYTLQATGEAASEEPKNSFTYTVTKSSGDDNYSEGKSLALVLTESNGTGTALKKDTILIVDGKSYSRNQNGQYIIPIGTIASGSKEITLHSDMFPDAETTYSLNGQLYLSDSNQAEAPVNGEKVGTETVFTFTKAKKGVPSLKVEGTQVATAAQWAQGQQITVDLKNVPTNGSVTVTAYSGIGGTQKVTDLLSSVSGLFDIESGVGTYNGGTSQNNQLVLSGTAKEGTYELRFEIKDSDGKTIQTVPYYIVVSE